MFCRGVLRLGCILLYIVAAALCQGGQGDDQCFNTWQGDLGSRGEKCDIFDGPRTLSMTCRINMGTKPNISLQWLYASQEDKAGLNGMVLQDGHSSNVRFNYSVTVLMAPGNQFIRVTLELHNEFEIGYYWCRVTGAMDTPNQNPSQVIRISSTCYSGIDCGRETLSTPQQASSRCANGNFAENITILDVQDTSACSIPLTDGPVATTEGNARTETTTQVSTSSTSLPTVSTSSTSLSSDSTTVESESRSLPVVTYVSITAVFIAILIVIVMIALIRKKVSLKSTHGEIYDEIRDTATTRSKQLQFTSDILTDGNPAYGTPASHLPTSSKEMEMTQNRFTPTNIPVEPNECYSSVNPDQLNATGDGTSQLAATGEYDYVIP